MMIFLQALPTVFQCPFEELMFFLTYDLESRNFSIDCSSNVYCLPLLAYCNSDHRCLSFCI